MSYINEILEFNQQFVVNKQYELYKTTKFPNKKIAILSCMDTRLTELLPAALNFRNGDIKIIKNAGATITHPFGSVMRSILVAVYELGVEEILVIGHHDCGMQHMEPTDLLEKMLKRGISQEVIDGVSYYGIDVQKWLKGFESVEDTVLETMEVIRSHPFMPKDVEVYGFIIDPETGKLTPVSSIKPEVCSDTVTNLVKREPKDDFLWHKNK